MCRGQREKLKEDAIQCCGEKNCEKKFLDAIPYAPPAKYKTVTYKVARSMSTGVVAGSGSQACDFKVLYNTYTERVVDTCQVKTKREEMCASGGISCSSGSGYCQNVDTQYLSCHYEPAWCKEWKPYVRNGVMSFTCYDYGE